MRNAALNTSEFELIPPDLDVAAQKHSEYAGHNPSTSPDRRRAIWVSVPVRYILFTLPIVLAIAPVVLLLAFSSRLSDELGKKGCTPSGEFVLPFTTSIWDFKRFFAITIAFLGPDWSSCSSTASTSPALSCDGYSFTQVKVIDIAWDILVGRGGQAVAVLFAYRIFGRAIKALMAQGEVGYDLFSAVAFDSGSAMSLISIVKHAAGFTPIPRTTRAVLVYASMGAATLYIVIVPSLLAAMTGYTSFYSPVMEFDINYGNLNSTATDCNGSILPVWARMQLVDDARNTRGEVYNALTPPGGAIVYQRDSGWIDYYHTYSTAYDACPVRTDISNCKEAQQKTYYQLYDQQIIIPKPMPGIVPYEESSTAVSKYTHWVCLERIFTIQQLDAGNTVGTCRAGSGYAWGFSFLLTFVTSILNLMFVLLIYGLHFESRRHDGSVKEVGEFKDAITMVTQAQQQYGMKIGEWSSSTLQREIVAGKLGISSADDVVLRKRNVRSHIETEFGDPRAGDWGGDVLMPGHRVNCISS